MLATTLVEIPQWGSVTLIELVWLLSGMVALLVTGLHVRPLWEDLDVAKTTTNRVVVIVARDYLRRELLRFLEGSLITFIGAYACASEPLAPGPAQITVVGLILTGVLLLIGCFVSVQSRWDWHSRKEINDLLGATRSDIKQSLQ